MRVEGMRYAVLPVVAAAALMHTGAGAAPCPPGSDHGAVELVSIDVPRIEVPIVELELTALDVRVDGLHRARARELRALADLGARIDAHRDGLDEARRARCEPRSPTGGSDGAIQRASRWLIETSTELTPKLAVLLGTAAKLAGKLVQSAVAFLA